MMKKVASLVIFWLGVMSIPVEASPWVEVADPYLRASIEQLASAGYLKGTRNTYPLPWSGIARDLREVNPGELEDELLFAFFRVRAALEFSQKPRSRRIKAQGSSAYKVSDIPNNDFSNSVREGAFFSTSSGFVGNHWAGRLQTTIRSNSSNQKNYHFEGSYLATTLGNWALSLEQVPAWWGPAHANALVLSNNSLAIQSLRLSRVSDTPLPGAEFLGHIHASAFIGRSQSASPVGDNEVAGGRLSIRPFESIELGSSIFRHFGSSDTSDNEFLALDGRISLGTSAGLYAELARSEKLRDDYAFTLGIDRRFGSQNRIWQAYIEYTDIPGFFYAGESIEAFELERFPHRRWDYSVGASFDQDVRSTSAGIQTQHASGHGWAIKFVSSTHGASNYPMFLRYRAPNVQNVRVRGVETNYQLPLREGLLKLGLGYRAERFDNVQNTQGIAAQSGMNFLVSWELRL